MGEIINFPNTEHVIYDLRPEQDKSWDMIIDAARRDGVAIYQYDGQYYELKVEDLDEGQTSAQDSAPTAEEG